MNIFRFGTVIALLASLSTTSLFSDNYTLNLCLEETFSPNEFSEPEEISGQIKLETKKYFCNDELTIDNGIIDKTTYIKNYQYFHSKNFSPTINNILSELILVESSSNIINNTELLYLINSSFLI